MHPPSERANDTTLERVVALATLVAWPCYGRAFEWWAVVAVPAVAVVLCALLQWRSDRDRVHVTRLLASIALTVGVLLAVPTSWSRCIDYLTHWTFEFAALATSALLARVTIAADRERCAQLQALAATEPVVVPRKAERGPFRSEPGFVTAAVPARVARALVRLRVRVAVLIAVACFDASVAAAVAWHQLGPYRPLRDVVQLAAGPDQTCARRADGSVFCWGARDRHVPREYVVTDFDWSAVEVDTLAGAVDLRFADERVCAHDVAGRDRCVVRGFPGLSSGAYGSGPLRGFYAVDCALDREGTVACRPHDRPDPRRAVLGGAAEIVLGDRHVCARLRDGTVRCWGLNDHGQLGDGSRQHQHEPALVVTR